MGAGPMGEQDRGFHADRIAVSYWDAQGNETVRYFLHTEYESESDQVSACPFDFLSAFWDKSEEATAGIPNSTNVIARGIAYSSLPGAAR